MIIKISRRICIILCVLLVSCYGVNKKTSEIFNLSFCCNNNTTWPLIFEEHKVVNVKDSNVQEILKDFKNQIHSSDIIYFKEYPEEYIGISENRMFIRYVYNKNISNQVLDGLSPQLSDSEKIRIGLRVITLQMNNLNEEGKKASIKIINEECERYLEKHEN